MDKRRTLIVGISVGVFVVGWILFRLLSARADLNEAAHQAEALRAALNSPQSHETGVAVKALQVSAASARHNLNDPLVRATSYVPILGRNVAAPRAVAIALDTVAQDALPQVVDVAGILQPEKVLLGGGRVNLDALRTAEGPVAHVAETLADIDKPLSKVSTRWLLPPVGSGVKEAKRVVHSAATRAQAGAMATRLVPSMLGGGGPRRYLLLFQNNAEVRATGGMPGAWAELEAVDGKLQLGKQGAANEFGKLDAPVLPLSPDELALFTDKLGTYFSDANFIPDWPRASELASARIKQELGTSFDGVIGVDPVAMSYLLRATGPVKPEVGATLTDENAIRLILNDPYLRYTDPLEQDAYFAAVTQSMFSAITGPSVNAPALADGLAKGVDERRLLVWSADPKEQRELAGTALGGVLSSGASMRPQIGFYLSDARGSKMEYYLTYSSKVRAVKCSVDGAQTFKASMTLSSSAPSNAADLPADITGGSGRAAELRPGNMYLAMNAFAPHHGEVTSVSTRGEPGDPSFASFAPGQWKGRGVGQTIIALEPGQTKTLDITLTSGPRSRGSAVVAMTPSAHANSRSTYSVASSCD